MNNKYIALSIERDKAQWLAETLAKCKGEKYQKLAREWENEVKRIDKILNDGIQQQFDFEEE